ncbi:hypothetical protein LTR56_008906 [Elasticomyces elasticus]|nr:hypothetical protein LTR56_008906 [Elasticomyces elasticus]KAK3663137.1 hypothetical protein LTR22_006046 [Elasticomyces elasticus]KAK4924033.1 hypothetical protein LTR49_008773 [Elasticomyces elasticus]KAK5764390.1 hypothetical protein LTS12_005366 [Elasticomyces elasticus]
MPSASDVYRMLSGQAFGQTHLPTVDLSGKTFVITGGNTGLGLDAAKHLSVTIQLSSSARANHLHRARLKASTLILGCRSIQKGEAAISAILCETHCASHTTIEVWEVDLDHYDSVVAFSRRVRSQLSRLDGFIANAGIELTKFELSECLERTLTINLVSTYLLAIAILPKLQDTAVANTVDTRLTIVGSIIHVFAPVAQLDVGQDQAILTSLSDPKTADMEQRYNLSKLMVHQMFVELVKHAPASTGKHRAIINLVNPGWCGTELSRNKEAAAFERAAFSMIGWTSEKGSRTLVHAVTSGPESHGCYLSQCQITPQGSYMRGEHGGKVGKRLWEETIRRIRQIDPETAEYVS